MVLVFQPDLWSKVKVVFPETTLPHAVSEPFQFSGGKQSENGKVGSEPDLGKLDLQLTYLWRVHGIDYYTGKEFADPTQFKLRVETTRTIRGPRPEEGEKPSEAEG